MYAIYLIDTVKFGEKWEATGGLRFDQFNTSYKQIVAPAVNLSNDAGMPSYRAAITYKPAPNGSIYFAFGTSFNPSAESLSLATSTAGLAPEENITYEVGTKWNVLNERLTLTGAIFQLSKINARVPDPTNSAFNVLGGNQRVRGFEIGVAGHITDRWQIYAGYAFLDNEVTSSTLPATVGQPLANTPKNTLSIWNSYDLPCTESRLAVACNGLTDELPVRLRTPPLAKSNWPQAITPFSSWGRCRYVLASTFR